MEVLSRRRGKGTNALHPSGALHAEAKVGSRQRVDRRLGFSVRFFDGTDSHKTDLHTADALDRFGYDPQPARLPGEDTDVA